MVLLLLIFCLLLLPLWESVIVLCFVVRYFMSILVIAIILIGQRELVALLNLSSWCLVLVEWLFLAVPWGCLQFVIVVFPDHTHISSYSPSDPNLNVLYPSSKLCDASTTTRPSAHRSPNETSTQNSRDSAPSVRAMHLAPIHLTTPPLHHQPTRTRHSTPG